MPEEQTAFENAVAAILEVVMFENWLRFYFIREQAQGDDGQLKIEIPEKSLGRIKELYPRLAGLAERMNGRPVDFETSRNSVIAYIAEEIDGRSIAKGEAEKILQSAAFQIRLNLFHTWAQLHEDQLERGFAEFGAWKELFAKWLETPGARELARRLAEDRARA